MCYEQLDNSIFRTLPLLTSDSNLYLCILFIRRLDDAMIQCLVSGQKPSSLYKCPLTHQVPVCAIATMLLVVDVQGDLQIVTPCSNFLLGNKAVVARRGS